GPGQCGRAQLGRERVLPALCAGLHGRRRAGRAPPRFHRLEGLRMLTAIWLLPLAGGLIVMLLPHRFAKWLGSLVGLGALGLAVYAAYAFDPAAHGYQFVERSPWIQQLGVDYFLGLDGISVWLVILNALISLIAILATPVDMRGAGRFVGLLLVMEAGMAGVFLAVTLLLSYVCWEAMLIPAYFPPCIWGEGS